MNERFIWSTAESFKDHAFIARAGCLWFRVCIHPLRKCEKKFSRSHNLMTHERVHTVEKPFSCSKCENKFSEGMLGRGMKEFILMKNHSPAQSVKRSSAVHTIWRHMKEYILMKNHSAAQNVTRSSVNHSIWRHMKEFILMKKAAIVLKEF